MILNLNSYDDEDNVDNDILQIIEIFEFEIREFDKDDLM